MLAAAARANADWCDAFSRSHGTAGSFDDACWWSPVRTPPLYPDAVTLAPGLDAGTLLERVDAGPGCSIKDSFADLALAPAGFQVLFRAEWLVARPDAAAPPDWVAVTSATELVAWEVAWGESAAPGFFRPELLANPAVRILARFDGGEVSAGAIAHRSAGAVGLSNVFETGADLECAWREAAAAANAWSGLPVAAYGHGAALAAARRAGFEPVGELAVWLR